MKSAGCLPVLACLLLAWPAAAAEPTESDKDVETPAEALRKGNQGKTDTDDGGAVGGGLWMVDEPDSDLEEPLPLGTEREFEDAGYEVLRHKGVVHYIVDRAGQIYLDRNYHGVIPGIRNWLRPKAAVKMRNRNYICWIGYQPFETISRVFFHFTNPNPQFEVTKIDRYTVEVRFPKTRIPVRNHYRTMYAEKFQGPIDTIRRVRGKRGTRIVIKLKRDANFLYRFEAPFLFVDFEN